MQEDPPSGRKSYFNSLLAWVRANRPRDSFIFGKSARFALLKSHDAPCGRGAEHAFAVLAMPGVPS
jgi:hypothetical protein